MEQITKQFFTIFSSVFLHIPLNLGEAIRESVKEKGPMI